MSESVAEVLPTANAIVEEVKEDSQAFIVGDLSVVPDTFTTPLVWNSIAPRSFPVEIPLANIKFQPFLFVAPLVAPPAWIVREFPAVSAVVWRLR